VARQTPLALDALDHRGFFAADVGARAAAQVNRAIAVQSFALQVRDGLDEYLAYRRVFVAQIDVDRFGIDGPRGYQHALEKAVRVALQVVAVLERTGLALVRIHRHQSRARFLPHEVPFAPCREAGAAETSQPGVLHRADHVVDRPGTVEAVAQQRVAAFFYVRIATDVLGNLGMVLATLYDRSNRTCIRVINMAVADLHHGRRIAAPHAGCADHAHFRAEFGRKRFEQCIAA
jgi:hypothetical protein